MRCIASHTSRRWRVDRSLSGRSNSNVASSRYDWICTHARNAMVFFFGAFAGTSGERKRMPVTCVSLALMPRVAKGARRQAWKSFMAGCLHRGGLARKAANFLEQLGGDAHAFARRALPIGEAPLAGEPHARVLGHRGDERLDALEENVVAGERARIHREERLA